MTSDRLQVKNSFFVRFFFMLVHLSAHVEGISVFRVWDFFICLDLFSNQSLTKLRTGETREIVRDRKTNIEAFSIKKSK